MSTTVQARDWSKYELPDFGDFADFVGYYNQEDDCGYWYYVMSDRPVIIYGTFGNDHSPGASHYTMAEVFDPDEMAGFNAAVAMLEAAPEYLDDGE